MEHKISISKLIILIVLNLFAMHTTEAAKPKLIVGIVVDQMRVDYLSRYESKFSEGGFKKLISGGYFNKNANFNYVPTYTGPGHASIFTGSTPRIMGLMLTIGMIKKQMLFNTVRKIPMSWVWEHLVNPEKCRRCI